MRALATAALIVASAGLALGAGCDGPARISLGAGTPSMTTNAVYYMSPTGDDDGPGTMDRPWRRFAKSLPKLAPGATLRLLDGPYERASSGYFDAKCPGTAPNGTATAPIKIVADHERAAILKGDAGGPPFKMEDCSHWQIEGLHIESGDFANTSDEIDAGSVVYLSTNNHDIALRRLLLAHPNRYKHSHVVKIGEGSSNVLVEECELYDFHHNALETARTESVVFRRNYINPRGMPDIMGAYVSTDPARGDYGIQLEETRYAIVENNVIEGTNAGIVILGRYMTVPLDQPMPLDDPLDHNRLLGNIVLNPSDAGIRLDSRCLGAVPCVRARTVLDTEITDDVVIGGAVGVYSAGAVGTQLSHVSILGAGSGVVAVEEMQNGSLASTTFATDVLAFSFQGAGFRAENQDQWSFDYCLAAAGGPGAASYSPDDAHVGNRVAVTPDLGGCLVYLPAGSALRVAGKNGGNVGAMILNRYDSGVLSPDSLWERPSGEFPCGASVSGVNDGNDDTCKTVHIDLHVNAGDCQLPPQ